ncbi:hypothetical protein ACU686_12585 [Yinghuangia aomiensis]
MTRDSASAAACRSRTPPRRSSSGTRRPCGPASLHTDLSELVLFPRPWQNSDGTQPFRPGHIGNVHRRWVNAMPSLLLGDGTEFPKLDVAPYSYRHSYAQRHAARNPAPTSCANSWATAPCRPPRPTTG